MTFDPLNGLGTPLKGSENEPDIVFPPMVSIDTDSGNVIDGSGHAIAVDSVVVTQTPGNIRVFVAKSFKITNAVISGTLDVAFVADGPIEIAGTIDASANMDASGPGGLTASSPADGADSIHGGGGGGNDTAGGDGGKKATSVGLQFGPGGSAQTVFEPLTGGGRGGSSTGTPPITNAGGGGGGMEIVSLASITIDAGALIDLGGGGGKADETNGSGGGGAGGTLVLEAPAISIAGGVFANGGSGGVVDTGGAMPCVHQGMDGSRDATAAAGGACAAGASAGSGGTGSIAATSASTEVTGQAGGGGAAGRVFAATADGTISMNGLVSATLTTQKLITQ